VHGADADRIESLERFLHEGFPPEDRFENSLPVVSLRDDALKIDTPRAGCDSANT
jgi:hypothetical protein